MRPTGLMLATLGVIVGCDSPKPAPTPPPPAPAAGAPAAPVGPAAAAKPAATALPVLELGDNDFVEGTSNRDPFRTFLREFNRPVRQLLRQQRKTILPRYALDELKLIAVVTGGTRPRAMFRDPSGLGVTVKRGDYISKNSGKIKQILSDKVVVEIEEQAEDRNTLVDRVIDLHPKEAEETEGSQGARPPENAEQPAEQAPAPPPAPQAKAPPVPTR